MSGGLKTRKLLEETGFVDEAPPPNPFAHEYGWDEVAVGLSKVLFGYLLIVGCVALIITITLVAAFHVGKQMAAGDLAKIDLGMVWFILGGMGLASLMSLGSYLLILAGKIRCAVYAPDRCGARWMIFICILCIVVGPVLNVGASFIKPDQTRIKEMQAQIEAGTFDWEESKIEILTELFGPTLIISAVGLVIGLLACIFFVLFFRAIGVCFDEPKLTGLAEIYLMYSGFLIGLTVFTIWSLFHHEFATILFLAVMAGWFLNLFWYVFLVFFTRCVILSYCRSVRKKALAD